jgi:putative intracellular protease/amidase
MRFGVFIYDGVEPIDLAAFGVLSMARRVAPGIEPVAIAPRAGRVALANGLEVVAPYGVDDAPPLEVLIVTGGPGWKAQCADPDTLAFVRDRARDTLVASVCTGGMILAASGVLDGLKATTKKEVIAGQEVPPLSSRRGIRIDACRRGSSTAGVSSPGGVTLCIDVVLTSWSASSTRVAMDRAHPRIRPRHASRGRFAVVAWAAAPLTASAAECQLGGRSAPWTTATSLRRRRDEGIPRIEKDSSCRWHAGNRQRCRNDVIQARRCRVFTAANKLANRRGGPGWEASRSLIAARPVVEDAPTACPLTSQRRARPRWPLIAHGRPASSLPMLATVPRSRCGARACRTAHRGGGVP